MNQPAEKAVVTVVGARPQFVKAAVVSLALKEAGVRELLVHTGQHYDHEMSDLLLQQLGINEVALNLGIGSGSQSHQTANMMKAFEDYLDSLTSEIEAILVYGDTNSTLAAALVAAKKGICLIHVEAGLRSFNMSMPEEINRILTDRVSALLFCTSVEGKENLEKEGCPGQIAVVGDVMLDAFQHYGSVSDRKVDLQKSYPGIDKSFALTTIHRPQNTDNIRQMETIVTSLGSLNSQVVWPAHPRTRGLIEQIDLPKNIFLIPPAGYLEMLALLKGANCIVTDSGGLQKEAYWAKKPCVTLRSETEWVETLENGWNVLCDPSRDDLASLVSQTRPDKWQPLYGDGTASAQIAHSIAKLLGDTE